jgi:hypothetical protein
MRRTKPSRSCNGAYRAVPLGLCDAATRVTLSTVVITKGNHIVTSALMTG